MTLTVELEPALNSSLRALAQAEGVSVERYLQRLIAQAVERRRCGGGALALLQDWDSEDATEDRAELARRERDWQAFREGLNRSHSSDRLLFP
jgi:hypothetical protein